MTKLQQEFEKVRLVHDYWDGPRTGIADYEGRPHWFENIFDQDKDDYSDLFWLTPLSDNTLRLAQHQAEIFSRWRLAFAEGQVDLASHPALPEDRETYECQAAAIKHEVASSAEKRFKARGQLKRLGTPPEPGMISDFQVKWLAEP